MSIAGILASSLFSSPSQTVQKSGQQFQQDFQQLGKDLKAGNTAAAQQDFAQIQQDLKSQGPQAHHHHHHGGGSEVSQLLSQLGQSLQSGNLAAAQQEYGSLQSTGLFASSAPASGVSVTA